MLNYLALLIPVFLLIVGIEWYISYKRGDYKYSASNTVMNMTIGVFDQLGSFVYFAALFLGLNFSYNNLSLLHLKMDWIQWVLAFIAIDFLSYWYHRFSHTINILWAGHVTHHSSEFYNLSNSFRTSLFQGINRIAFWMLLPVFGFSPLVLIITFKATGIYEFFQHSAYIPQLGFLEKILITPSHHRVHHAKNEVYLDKNFGSIFLIWDKIFGTFQPETEPLEFGIKGEYEDNNAIKAVTHHYSNLWVMIKSSTKISDKLKILIKQPGWVPNSLQPVPKQPRTLRQPSSKLHLEYALFQVCVATIGFTIYMFYSDFLSLKELIYLGGAIAATMYSATLILKNNLSEHYDWLENIRLTAGLIFSIILILKIQSMYLWLIPVFWLVSLAIHNRWFSEKTRPIEDTWV